MFRKYVEVIIEFENGFWGERVWEGGGEEGVKEGEERGRDGEEGEKDGEEGEGE